MIIASVMCLLLVGLAVICIASRYAARGKSYSFEKLAVVLDALRDRGFANGFLVVECRSKRELFLQFEKYILAKGEYGIELAFPLSHAMKKYEASLVEVCRSEGLRIRRLSGSGAKPLDFLCVDFGRNTGLASAFAKSVFVTIFGCSLNTKLGVLLENASLENRIVDDPTEVAVYDARSVKKHLGNLINTIRESPNIRRKG